MKLKRSIPLLLAGLLAVTLLAGCDSKNVKQAREAYEAGNYERVIDLLQDEEFEDALLQEHLIESRIRVAFASDDYRTVSDLCTEYPDVGAPLAEERRISDIHLAFAAGEYEKALSLITEADLSDSALSEMYYASTAHAAYEKEDYAAALEALFKTADPLHADIYKDAAEHVIAGSIADRDTKAIAALLESDYTLSAILMERLSSEEYKYDYENWCFIESLLAEFPSSAYKYDLYEYYNANLQNRVFSYLLGDWTYGDDDATYIIHVDFDEEDPEKLIGIVTSIGGKNAYKHEVGEVYWYNFDITGRDTILSNQLGRFTSGKAAENTAVWKIDYETETVQIKLSTAVLSNLITPFRTWTRVQPSEEDAGEQP